MGRRTYRRTTGRRRELWLLGLTLGGVAVASIALIVFFEAPDEMPEFNSDESTATSDGPETESPDSRTSFLPGSNPSPRRSSDTDAQKSTTDADKSTADTAKPATGSDEK